MENILIHWSVAQADSNNEKMEVKNLVEQTRTTLNTP